VPAERVTTTLEFSDKVIVPGVFPLAGVAVRKLPPVLETNETAKGSLDPVTALVTCTVWDPGRDVDPAAMLNVAVLAESVIKEAAAVTFRVTGT
jgi:hypothetical protein